MKLSSLTFETPQLVHDDSYNHVKESISFKNYLVMSNAIL